MSGTGATAQRQKPDYSESHAFPSTCKQVIELGSDTETMMIIRGTGDPGTDYSKAPLGSLYINQTQGSAHIKTAQPNTWSDTGP